MERNNTYGIVNKTDLIGGSHYSRCGKMKLESFFSLVFYCLNS